MANIRTISAIVALVLMAMPGLAQVNRYMVFFKDKEGSAYNVSNPSHFLSEKAIARRIRQAVPVTLQDIPVNENYVEGVRNAGASVYFRSRWFNGVLVQCEQSVVSALKGLPYVDTVEYVAPNPRLFPQGRRKFNLKRKNTRAEAVTNTQLSLIGINYMHAAGHRGEGVTIAVLDAGFPGVNTVPAFSELFAEGRIDETVSFDFVTNSGNVFQFDDHGTEVLSVMAALVPDAYTGGAPDARYQLYVTEDATSEYRVEEYNWAFAAERADSAGADIISSSLGYYDFDDGTMNYSKLQMDGATAVVTKAAAWAADRGMVVVCSAGNEGNLAWKIITAPADAERVLAVASVDAGGARSSSSSTGPASDGRIKPDLAAMGVGVKVITASGDISSASGTSLAAPLITSLVAGVWQRYPDLTNDEIMALIKATASRANDPNNSVGYGIPNFRAVVNYHEPIEQEEIFSVYPNPIKDTVMVSPFDPDSISSCAIEIINPLGEMVATEQVSFSWYNRIYQTSLAALPAGFYFVRVSWNNRRFVFKVAKE